MSIDGRNRRRAVYASNRLRTLLLFFLELLVLTLLVLAATDPQLPLREKNLNYGFFCLRGLMERIN